MSASSSAPFDRGEVACSYHPSVTTRLRCSRCGKPICPKCGVRTPVGLRCPECAGVRGLPTYRTSSAVLARASAAGLAVAVGTGLVWGFLPAWGFYFALLLGFGIAESISAMSRHKRGLDLQLVAISMVLLGIVISRTILAQRYGVGFAELNALDSAVSSPEIFDDFRRPVSVTEALRLNFFPDLIYTGLAIAIAWVRFR